MNRSKFSLGLLGVLIVVIAALTSSARQTQAATTVEYSLPFRPNNGAYATASDVNQWYSSSGHPAYDFGLDEGEAVFAAASGNVSVGYQDNGYGYYIKVQHSDGCVTDYAHLSKQLVTQGKVVAGKKIGLAGKTGAASGPHLHFQLNCKDSSGTWKAINPGNPTLSSGCGRWATCPATPAPATPGPVPSNGLPGDEVQAYWANLVGDDKEDALVYNPVAGGYAIWDFTTDTQARSGGWSAGWTHVVLGNFTGDYHTDAIVYNRSSGVGVLVDFNGPGGYQQVRTYSWSSGWTDIIGGNFVGDGWEELLFYKSTSGGAVVWNPRTDTLIVSKSWSAGWTHVVRGNFSGDSHTDVLVYNSGKTGSNVVVTDFAANQQTYVASWSTGWAHIVPGDMVGEAHTDVLAYSKSRVTAAVVDFNGNPSTPYDVGTGFTNVVTGDLVGDGKHEALLYNATTGKVIVFSFSSGTKVVDKTWSTGWAQTLTGNFVGDSKRDVLVYNPNTGVAAIVSFSPSYAQPWTKTWSKGWIVYS